MQSMNSTVAATAAIDALQPEQTIAWGEYGGTARVKRTTDDAVWIAAKIGGQVVTQKFRKTSGVLRIHMGLAAPEPRRNRALVERGPA